MGRRKRTVSKDLNEEDSFKQNRSSLNVNLSCMTNLTDSGNGSFKTMEAGHDSLTNTGRSTRSRTRLKSVLQKEIHKSGTSSKNVTLKNVSVVLEDINKVDKVLNTKCKILSDAILSKTQQIFHKESELSIKTAMVLQNLSCEGNKKHNNEVHVLKNSMIIANNDDKFLNQSDHNVCTLPKKKQEYELHNKAQQKTCLDNKVLENLTTRASPILERSPILTQGRRKLNASKFVMPKAKKLYSRNEPSESESICSQNTSSVSDASMLGVFPLACSSMLEEWTSSQSKVCTGVETKKTLLSMEMTGVCGGFIIEETSKSQNSSQNCHTAHKSRKNRIIAENNSHETESFVGIEHLNKHTQGSMKEQPSRNCLSQHVQMNLDGIEESIDCRRSSMNVNTSIDVITENNNACTTHKRINRIDDGQLNSVSKAVEETCEIIPQEEQESICVISESLQMNTSLRGPFRSSFRDSNIRNLNCSNSNEKTDAVHNNSSANTIQIYNKENISNSESSRNTDNVTTRETEMEGWNNTIRNKTKKSINDNVAGKSYVEPTPYPPTRSMIWKSLVRQNTGLHSLSYKNNDTDVCSQLHRTPKNTVIIADSDVENSLDSVPNKTKDMDNNSTKQKTNRRKLQPLRENSGLFSFSPVEDRYIPQTQNLFPRKKKKIPKKTTKIKRDSASPHVPEEKPENKKQKQPRKIKSKKIVIKKLTNVDILKKLEDQRRPDKNLSDIGYNTASPCEFQKKKYISTAKSAKDLIHKVVIVTTGLSKEDKSLVKSVIKTIGKARMEASVSPRTTYVVTTGVRTLNLLHGIIRGCWLVTMKWVLESLEHKQWLDPEKYEIVHFSEAVMANRKERIRAQQYGVSYVPDLFSASGLIYVENGTSPPASALKDLIKVAGGQITENMRTANICISSSGLRETWILDSITTGELQPFALYKRN